MINFVPPCFRDGNPTSVQDCLLGTIKSHPFTEPNGHVVPYGVIPYYTQFLFWIVGLTAFLFILYGGYQMLTAFGDEAKFTAAKKTVTNAIYGLILATLAGVLVSIFKNFIIRGSL